MKVSVKHISCFIVSWIFAIFNTSCDTEGNSEPRFEDYYIKYYGGDGNQTGVALTAYNEGFVVVGNSALINGESKLFVVYIDALGNEIWSHTYGDLLSLDAVDVETDRDNNLVIAVTVQNPADQDIAFFKIGPDGSRIDSLIYRSPGFDEVARDLLITDNNDYVITGYTTDVDVAKADYNPVTDFEDILSIRVSSDLILFDPANWRRVYGFSGIDRGEALVQKDDGSFLFFGSTDRIPTGNSTANPELNMFVFPAGQDGIASSTSPFQWFGNSQTQEIASSISPTSSFGFVMVGSAVQSNTISNIFFAVIRNNDALINSASVNTAANVQAVGVIEDVRGGYLIIGNETIDNMTNLILLKTSVDGILEWSRSFGGADNDLAGNILQLQDGSILMTGTVELESQSKMTLIKTNPMGLLSP